MKIMVISDIHGVIEYLKEAIECYRFEKADKLVILGDFLSYYGTSEDQEVCDLLNSMASEIVAVEGNCDRGGDEFFSFELPVLNRLYVNGVIVTMSHGHLYNAMNLPSNCGPVFLQGHTHVPLLEKRRDTIVANPGSISRPRGVDLRCYLLLDEENKIWLKTLNGKIVKSLKIDE
ncbi:MAG: YfcE family phosphodiesterase [Clostridia bacterium]|nr:YfcE family phosphodiesterase [Clostridia bacterium]